MSAILIITATEKPTGGVTVEYTTLEPAAATELENKWVDKVADAIHLLMQVLDDRAALRKDGAS